MSPPRHTSTRPTWLRPAVLAATALAAASGFASFGVTAALGDVANAFGEPDPERAVAATAGLTATTVGMGLAIIRLASLGALALAGLADRLGRRKVILTCVAGGLSFTVLSALSPSYWWFVAVFALARPLLSAVNAIAAVIAAEESSSADRAKGIALISVGYAVGAGLTSIVRLAIPDAWGFRGLFALALIPLLVVPLARRALPETRRFETVSGAPARPAFGTVPAGLLARLLIVCVLHFGLGFATGPFNTNLFFYGENVLGMSPAAMAGIFVASGVLGLAGILAGRWAADRLGRRITAGISLAAVSVAGMVVYSGAEAGVAMGYVLSVFAASTYTPAAGAIDAELFPTNVRATAAGWITGANVVGAVAGLAAFGLLVDAFASFRVAAVIIALPVAALSTLYGFLPETLGRDLEDTYQRAEG